jgi:hypothetical protein
LSIAEYCDISRKESISLLYGTSEVNSEIPPLPPFEKGGTGGFPWFAGEEKLLRSAEGDIQYHHKGEAGHGAQGGRVRVAADLGFGDDFLDDDINHSPRGES